MTVRSVVALVGAIVVAAPVIAHAECDRLTPRLAARISATLRPRAPAWARPLIAPAQLMRFDSAALRPFTYFLGYGAFTIERLGTNGAAPYNASVVVRCRDGLSTIVSDPYAWANARARELNVRLTTSEQAAGYAAEVLSLRLGRRPDAANARRQSGLYHVQVSLAPRASDPTPAMIEVEVARDGSIRDWPQAQTQTQTP